MSQVCIKLIHIQYYISACVKYILYNNAHGRRLHVRIALLQTIVESSEIIRMLYS